jgi:hypothetical protein
VEYEPIDNHVGEIMVADDQQYQEYDDWGNIHYSDEFVELETGPSIKIVPLLFLIMVINFGWMLFVVSEAIRSMSIPAIIIYVPYLATWIFLVPSAMFNKRIIGGISFNRFCVIWFFVSTIISLVNHPLASNGFMRVMGFAILGSIGYILLPSAYNWATIIRVLRFVIITGALISLVACLPNRFDGGIFHNPNTMGFTALLGLVALGGDFPKSKKGAVLYVSIILYFGLMLLMSRSRTSVLSATVCALVLFWKYRKQAGMWLIGILTVVLMLAISFSISYEGLTLYDRIVHKTRYQSGHLDITSGRAEIWREIDQITKERGLTGAGIGALVSYYDANPHSAYAAIRIELGNIGFVAFLLMIISGMLQTIKIRKCCDPQLISVVDNGLLLIVAVAVFNLFENGLGSILGQSAFVFWICSGALANAAAEARRYGYVELR